MSVQGTEIFNAKNLGDEFLQLQQNYNQGLPTAVLGVSSVAAKSVLAAVCERPFLYIAQTHQLACQMQEQIQGITNKSCTLLTAKDDVLLLKLAYSKESLFKRICALNQVFEGGQIIITDVNAVMQKVPTNLPQQKLCKNGEYEIEKLINTLVYFGYRREFAADAKGTFSLRGDILDIYPINFENPVRVDFFGDVVENMYFFDALTTQRLEDVDSLTILPATDFLAPQDHLPILLELQSELARYSHKNKAAFEKAAMQIAANLEQHITDFSLSYVAPLSPNFTSIFEVLSKDYVVILDEPKLLNDKAKEIIAENTLRHKDLYNDGLTLQCSINHYLQPQALFDLLNKTNLHAFQNFSGASFFNALSVLRLSIGSIERYLYNLRALAGDVRAWLKNGYKVYIFTQNQTRGEKLADALFLNGVCCAFNDKKNCAVLVNSWLDRGMILHSAKIAVIGSGDLYYKKQTQKKLRRKPGDLFVSPEVGDYAVHEQHGIGKIIATKKIELSDGAKDYIALEYKGGDVLYVPVEQMNTLSKYMGEGQPSVSKIGGTEFERIKARVGASIKKLAIDLKKLYAERAEQKGYKFEPDNMFTQEFENAFEFDPTPDQLQAIEEIKQDMESDKVMDRLLCGDVGFGKTEVAFRAIFKAINSGKQCALLCPTTILSEQHYKTALKRFDGFGVRIAVLNRFKTTKEQGEILQRLKNGQIDLIIGTHRLLGKDVKFFDLGLLVLDEEQRFGVEHKEKLKTIKSDVDSLTMTATPIPRTLYMSLTGIRDISMIETPPENRLPVETAVVEESQTLIRDACIRELSRGGQVFILYNRVESIDNFALKIKQLVPEGQVVITHGQMNESILEKNISGFYLGASNILVTTTIIENGIDLPKANTIIIIDSDRLGISQLYQLRGRVGRSGRLAKAFFTFKADKLLSQDAIKRLNAVMEFTELGSGYKIAARDLEIRGAGNVLGGQQHGHIVKIGYELYAKLLKEEMLGESTKPCEVDIKVSAFIAESYIENQSARLDAYKKIAEIQSQEEARIISHSLIETFGKMPQGVVNLITIALIKAFATKIGAKNIKVENRFAQIEFDSFADFNKESTVNALTKASYASLQASSVPLIKINAQPNQNILVTLLGFIKTAAVQVKK